jgi:type III pantothenate kinase
LRKERTLLTVDVGNTDSVVGLFQGEMISAAFRFASRLQMTADECYLLVNLAVQEAGFIPPFEGAAICSVVPQLTGTFEAAFSRLSKEKPLTVKGTLKTGIRIRIDHPEQVGADRIANAVAAHMYYGGDLIVVDLGTATTFDVVSGEGEYLGGVIAAGIATSAARLFEKAAMLPRLDIELAGPVIGKNTEEAMRSGIYYGAVSQIDGLVARIQDEWGRKGKVIATGGYARLISQGSRTIDIVDPELTLKGIRAIWEAQRESR